MLSWKSDKDFHKKYLSHELLHKLGPILIFIHYYYNQHETGMNVLAIRCYDDVYGIYLLTPIMRSRQPNTARQSLRILSENKNISFAWKQAIIHT